MTDKKNVRTTFKAEDLEPILLEEERQRQENAELIQDAISTLSAQVVSDGRDVVVLPKVEHNPAHPPIAYHLNPATTLNLADELIKRVRGSLGPSVHLLKT